MTAPLPKPARLTAAARLAQRRRPLGYREPITRTNASNCDSLAFPNGNRQAEQQARREEHNAVVKAVRAAVWQRSSFCECCGDTERETAGKWPKAEHELHEHRPRSLTKGLPPRVRFSTAGCVRLCGPCHSAIGAKRVRLLPLTLEGFDAAYDVQAKNADDEWQTVLTVDRKRGLRA